MRNLQKWTLRKPPFPFVNKAKYPLPLKWKKFHGREIFEAYILHAKFFEVDTLLKEKFPNLNVFKNSVEIHFFKSFSRNLFFINSWCFFYSFFINLSWNPFANRWKMCLKIANEWQNWWAHIFSSFFQEWRKHRNWWRTASLIFRL